MRAAMSGCQFIGKKRRLPQYRRRRRPIVGMSGGLKQLNFYVARSFACSAAQGTGFSGHAGRRVRRRSEQRRSSRRGRTTRDSGRDESVRTAICCDLGARVVQCLRDESRFCGAHAQVTTPSVFRDITYGASGAYRAGSGWDFVTGWGTPNVSMLYSSVCNSARAVYSAGINEGTTLKPLVIRSVGIDAPCEPTTRRLPAPLNTPPSPSSPPSTAAP